MSIRSGRFYYDNRTTAGSYTIVEVSSNKGSTAIYRLLNSGEVPFTIDVGNGVRTLAVNNSIDLAIGQKTSLEVSWAAPGSAKNVSLSYNLIGCEDGISLENDDDLRSGRFTGVPTASNAVLVDLGSAGRAAYYRVFNSGADVLKVEAGGFGSGSTPTQISIPSKFSKDILVTNANPGGKMLKIVAGTTSVDVIYDLLGGVE
ncbi:MAG: hypothetical protein R3C49_11245 [Planctomycetaceae bacterium]